MTNRVHMTVSTVCAEHNMGEPGQHYQNCTACGHPMRQPWSVPRDWLTHADGYCLFCRRHLEAEPVAASADPDLERLHRLDKTAAPTHRISPVFGHGAYDA